MRKFEHVTTPLLRELVMHACEQGDRIAIRCDRTCQDYAKLMRRFERVTAHLAATHGITPGQHVVTLAANDDLQLVVLLACLRLGAIWVPLDPTLCASRLQNQLAQVNAALIVADAARMPVAHALVTKVRAEMRCVLLDQLIDRPAPYGQHYPDEKHDALAFILFGADPADKPTPYVQKDLLTVQSDIQAADNVLIAMPLARAESLLSAALPALARGAALTLLPQFNATTWLEAIARTQPTVAALTIAMTNALVESPMWTSADLRSLRRLDIVDGVLDAALRTQFAARGWRG